MKQGRPKGSKTHNGKCNVCSEVLIVEKNWWKSSAKNKIYKCNDCCVNNQMQWEKDNPNKKIKFNKNQRIKEGTGVYQVMLGEICMYVGEGQLKARKDRHLKFNTKDSKVFQYCLKHNINRSLLSFNVLELQDDTVHRKELEDWYTTFLTPVINPKPPLGLYVL